MYETYTATGLILVIFGVLSSAYFVYFIKANGLKNLAITALSESLVTILIGIFYIYCASVLSQPIIPTDNDNVSFTLENLSDVVTINVEETAFTTEFEELLAETTTALDGPQDDFLIKYQTLINDMIKNRPELDQIVPTNLKRRPKSLPSESEIDCFLEVFMENSMYLYSFIHCVLSLVISTINWKDCEFTGNCNEGPQKKKTVIRLATETVTEGLLPMLVLVILYKLMTFDVPADLNFNQFENFTQPDWLTIIQKPPENITTYSNKNEVDKVVSRVYEVVNNTKHNGQVPPKLSHSFANFLMKHREPKAAQTCDETLTKLSAIGMILMYFSTILYSKTTQIQVKFNKGAASRHLNASIITFASLWLPAVVGTFSKAFLPKYHTSRRLNEVFLSLGNVNRLSTVAIGYISMRNLMKRINAVQPKV